MDTNDLKEQIKRLVDEASVIAPSISRFEQDNDYGKVTDGIFDFDAFVSWKMEAKAILNLLSNSNSDLFSDLYKEYLSIEEESKQWHSKSIFVHRVRQLLVGSFSLIDSPLVNIYTQSGASNITDNTEVIWSKIKNDFGVSKHSFGNKIKFVEDEFKRKIIFRDIEHSYTLAVNDFSKPAVILAGSVIEELLRLYLIYNKIHISNDTFNEYIKICENQGLLKAGISKLSYSVRHFRNLVHMKYELSMKHTISKAAAMNAVSSIFIIANDF